MNAKESPSAFTSFSVCLPCFSISFLLQRPFLFSSASFSFQFLSLFFLVLLFFLVSAPFLLLFNAPFFFSVDVLPFFSLKSFPAQKSLFFSPIHACLCVKMKSNRLPQNQEGPAFHANSQAKKKKNLPSASIHPKPNSLSSCFVSFI